MSEEKLENGEEEIKKKRKLNRGGISFLVFLLDTHGGVQNFEQDPSKLYINKDDLIIWPIEQVQNNFQRFLQMTSDIKKDEQDLFGEFSQEVEWPIEQEMLAVFDSSLQKIQGRQNKKKWKDNEKSLLNCVIIRYCLWKNTAPKILSDEDWRNIAKLIVGRNATQCKYKWLAKSKFKLVQIPWTKEEDEALRSIYQYNEYQRQGKHNKWSDIAKEIALRCKTTIVRQGKQCRERWINKLDPQISKGPWIRTEELKLLKLILLKGKKWSEISKLLKNTRTENSLKNRYHTLIKKEKNKGDIVEHIPQSQISEIIASLQLSPEFPIDVPHLYEDIDPQELQLIMRLIKRLEIEVPGEELSDEPEQNQQSQPNSKEKGEEALPKQFQLKIRQRFFEEMENVKIQMDNQISNNPKDGKPENTNEESTIINALQQLVQMRTQEREIDYKAVESYYKNLMKNVDPNAEYHVEPFTSLDQNELNECSFGLVDFCSSQLYVFPTEYLNAVVNKLKDQPKSGSKQAPEQKAVQMNQQVMPAALPPQMQPQQSTQPQMMQQIQYMPINFMYPMYQQFIPMMVPLYYKPGQNEGTQDVQVKCEQIDDQNQVASQQMYLNMPNGGQMMQAMGPGQMMGNMGSMQVSQMSQMQMPGQMLNQFGNQMAAQMTQYGGQMLQQMGTSSSGMTNSTGGPTQTSTSMVGSVMHPMSMMGGQLGMGGSMMNSMGNQLAGSIGTGINPLNSSSQANNPGTQGLNSHLSQSLGGYVQITNSVQLEK